VEIGEKKKEFLRSRQGRPGKREPQHPEDSSRMTPMRTLKKEGGKIIRGWGGDPKGEG